MKRKLPPDALAYYLSLGLERSYQAVADHYHVSKAAVSNRAQKEDWQGRVLEIEDKARQKATEKAAETMEEISNRHLRAMRVIQAKALETLKSMSLDTAMEAVRSLELAVKGERLIMGEPSDRTALSVEDMRQRFELWTTEVEEASANGRVHEEA